jgi:AraC-like DNA-binding protein
MKLHIKYMVSLRCKMVVKAELDKLGIRYGAIDLGEANITDKLTTAQYATLKIELMKSGLELMEDKKAVLIEKIKNVIIEMVHYADEMPLVKNSEYLSEKLQYDYTYLANTFSEAAGITIEHYIIKHKIERVKELLLYDEMNLTQISYKLNYSSVAHLSKQFKKVTGLTPTYFKQMKKKRLKTLERI